MHPDVQYLLSLQAIRDRAKLVGEVAQAGKLNHFDLHQDRLDDVVDFVVSVIQRDFGPDRFDQIPPHGRWQHFEVGGVPRVADLLHEWKMSGLDIKEETRRLIDLFFVSVLLDAGAGDHWRFSEGETGQIYERSEGIAVASLHMFKSLAFTAVNGPGSPPVVDGKGLEQLTEEALSTGFQVSDTNPMLGMGSRAALLRSLGTSLLENSDVFGPEGRPGNLVDYMVSTATEPRKLDVLVLWDVLQKLLIPIWPKDRTVIEGVPIGDAWPLTCLGNHPTAETAAAAATHIQPFHKLTQWLTYSLMVPFQRVMRKEWINAGSLTALPEYRNGGLFVDMGVLSLKKDSLERGLKASAAGGGSSQQLPLFDAGDDVIVEWRAMTLVLIDQLYEKILVKMGSENQLSMAQLLEAGSWKSGREIAARNRPQTKSSPILINSDGTVF